MSKESIVFSVGIIVFLAPFAGLPSQYKETLFAVCGGILIITGYRLRRRAFLKSLEHESGERRGDAFVESGMTGETESTSVKDGERVI